MTSVVLDQAQLTAITDGLRLCAEWERGLVIVLGACFCVLVASFIRGGR